MAAPFKVLWVAFSIAVGILALIMVFTFVAPRIVYPTCWGEFMTGVNALARLRFQKSEIVVGHCVESLNFVNKKNLGRFPTAECPVKAEAYLIAVPKSSLAEKIGVSSPVCRGLPMPFSGHPASIKGPDEGSDVYCGQLVEGDGEIDVVMEAGKCLA